MTTPAAPDSLRVKVMGGLRWKLLSQLVAQGSRIAVGILLAHLLTPKQFGLAAMALIFTGLAGIFSDLSLGSALVQRSTITEQDRSTVFWTTAGSGLIMTAIGIAIAPLMGRFFSTPEVVPLFAAASALTFISGLAVTQMALLTRELNFRSLELRGICSVLVGIVPAVAMAFTGFGAWAIVTQALCTAAVSTGLVWHLSPWRPQWIYSRASFRTLGSFGLKTLFSRLLGYFETNADNLLIGHYLGSRPLGVYSVAFNLMFQPLGLIAQPIQQVLFAAFVKLKGETDRLGQAWLRGTQLVAAINVPAFLGIAVVAPDFVPSILGPQWNAAVPVLQLLSLAGAVHTLQTLNWSVMQAMGQPGRLLRFMTFSSCLTVAAFALGLRWGVVGVAGLYAVARATSVVCFIWLTCRTVGLPVLHFVRSVSWVLALSIPMAICVYLARLALVHEGLSTGARLALEVLLGTGVYGALFVWRAPELLSDVRDLVRQRRYVS